MNNKPALVRTPYALKLAADVPKLRDFFAPADAAGTVKPEL